MKIIMDIDKAKSEINWVIKLVESVQTKDQLHTALKCYLLWELKHIPKNSNHPIKFGLKSKFWACYRNKESQFYFSYNTLD